MSFGDVKKMAPCCRLNHIAMIMRLTRWLAAASIAVIISVLMLVSCGPDLSDIHLSDCMGSCNVTVKQCLEKSNTHLDSCSFVDKECQGLAITETESCLTSCLDCIGVCVQAAEAQLKK